MSGSFRAVLPIFLIVCILTVGGLAQVQAAEHAGHHAQHQTATHGTLLCSWMCAAGAVLDSEAVVIQVQRTPLAFVPVLQSSRVVSELSYIVPSRAPPSFFL
ncbi:MAG: hypothetical protein U0223_10335 [Nitrospira sp.]|nr:hypothetical protein [Nitrospira sp.]